MMPVNPRLKLLPDGPYLEIDGESLYLGRDCHLAVTILALKNKVVSNRHLCIRRERDGRWTIEDLRSTNGTWLRGIRLSKQQVLVSGDIVSLGRNGPRLLCEFPSPPDVSSTMPEDDIAAAATQLTSPDGSADRPYRVGRTPEVALLHQRTGQEFSAKGYTIVLGRDPDVAQIVVRTAEEKHVSARHAELQFRTDGRVMLRDLGSRNGTWLNDRKVSGPVAVRAGDRLVLGAPLTSLVLVRIEL